MKEIIFNKSKRKFFKFATKIIESKLSLEYKMRYYFNFEKLRLLFPNQELIDFSNNTLQNLKIEKPSDVKK